MGTRDDASQTADPGRAEGFIDLHVHTTRSDGDYSPSEVVAKAVKIGLKAIAITDHDSVDGVAEGLDAGAAAGLEVVPGIELDVKYADLTQVHLLGYYVDWHDKALNDRLTELRDARVGRGRRLLERINRILQSESREPIPFAEVEAHSDGLIGRPHIAKALNDRGYAKGMPEAFRKYLIPYNIPKAKPPLDEAVEALRGAGAIPVLAHPNLIIPGRRLDVKSLDRMVEMGLEGLEVFYQSLGGEDTAYYLSLASERGLAITGGSDFHGEASYGNLGMVGKGDKVPARHLAEIKRRYLGRNAFLVVLSGLPGCGKSTLAARLSRILDAAVVSSDEIRMTHFPPGSADRSFRYSAEVSSAVYRIMRLEAEVSLMKGRSVIMDATFLLREGRPELIETARKLRVPIVFVSCRADEEVVAKRTGERVNGANGFSEADFDVYKRMKADLAADHDRLSFVEDDPQLAGFPVLRWNSAPGAENLEIVRNPDNLSYILKFASP